MSSAGIDTNQISLIRFLVKFEGGSTGISGIHFIQILRMKDWVKHGATS